MRVMQVALMKQKLDQPIFDAGGYIFQKVDNTTSGSQSSKDSQAICKEGSSNKSQNYGDKLKSQSDPTSFQQK